MSTDGMLFDDKGNIIEESSEPQSMKVPEDLKDQISQGTDETPDTLTDEDLGEETPENPEEPSDDHPDDLPVDGEDPDRAALRERRRQERQLKKNRIREREETLRSELAIRDAELSELRGQVEAIQRKNVSAEMAQLQAAKGQVLQSYNHYKRQIQLATEAADGAGVADATEKMLLSQRKLMELEGIERAYQNNQSRPAPLDPRLKQHAEGWMKKNSWYDPAGRDPDSRVMLTLDTTMAEEGWNPSTPQYWEELTKRAQRYLPHRFQKSKPSTNQPQRNVVGGSGREQSGASVPTSGGYRLSPERIQAIKDAGRWNDPAERAKAIADYKKYDKENGLK